MAVDQDGVSELPVSVRATVWTRMARLSSEERRVLELASLCPGSCEEWLLESLMGEGFAAALDACDEAERLFDDLKEGMIEEFFERLLIQAAPAALEWGVFAGGLLASVLTTSKAHT
jgi:hypothetical protein